MSQADAYCRMSYMLGIGRSYPSAKAAAGGRLAEIERKKA